MGGYVVNFTVYTMAMVGLICFAVFVYKKIMDGSIRKDNSKFLSLEESMSLTPRKTLHVVRAGNEKFLIASDVDRTTLIAKLGVNVRGADEISQGLRYSEGVNVRGADEILQGLRYSEGVNVRGVDEISQGLRYSEGVNVQNVEAPDFKELLAMQTPEPSIAKVSEQKYQARTVQESEIPVELASVRRNRPPRRVDRAAGMSIDFPKSERHSGKSTMQEMAKRINEL